MSAAALVTVSSACIARAVSSDLQSELSLPPLHLSSHQLCPSVVEAAIPFVSQMGQCRGCGWWRVEC